MALSIPPVMVALPLCCTMLSPIFRILFLLTFFNHQLKLRDYRTFVFAGPGSLVTVIRSRGLLLSAECSPSRCPACSSLAIRRSEQSAANSHYRESLRHPPTHFPFPSRPRPHRHAPLAPSYSYANRQSINLVQNPLLALSPPSSASAVCQTLPNTIFLYPCVSQAQRYLELHSLTIDLLLGLRR
jgi:hypothetical protein